MSGAIIHAMRLRSSPRAADSAAQPQRIANANGTAPKLMFQSGPTPCATQGNDPFHRAAIRTIPYIERMAAEAYVPAVNPRRKEDIGFAARDAYVASSATHAQFSVHPIAITTASAKVEELSQVPGSNALEAT